MCLVPCAYVAYLHDAFERCALICDPRYDSQHTAQTKMHTRHRAIRDEFVVALILLCLELESLLLLLFDAPWQRQRFHLIEIFVAVIRLQYTTDDVVH